MECSVEGLDVGTHYWIGLQYNKTSGYFEWNSDGKPAWQTEKNWEEGNPSYDGDCVHMSGTNSFKWNDRECRTSNNAGHPFYALCQLVFPRQTTIPPTSSVTGTTNTTPTTPATTTI
jgi:hypothetical protein